MHARNKILGSFLAFTEGKQSHCISNRWQNYIRKKYSIITPDKF